MNNLRKVLLITIAFVTTVLAPSAMNAQTPSGNWSDSDNRDTSWGTDYETASSFTINSPEQLAQFAYMVNSGSDFSGKTVTLDNAQQIEHYPWGDQVYTYTYYNLRDHYWTPVGTAEHQFKGTFDGNGKSVNYVLINGEDSYQGFFGYIGIGGTVISTTVRLSTITAASQVGAIAGYNGGTMTNCVVTDNTITGSSYAGAIVGQNAGTMTTCYAIYPGSTKAIGASGSATGTDVAGEGQCLWRILGKNSGEGQLSIGYSAQETDKDAWVSTGNETGTVVGDAIFCTDGMKYNYYHYYKTGATSTITSNMHGYDVTFSVSGTDASISGNDITVGAGDVTVSLASQTVAEWSGSGESANDPYIINIREQLDMLATRVNNGTSTYENKFFRLDNSISYGNASGLVYTVIGDATHPFCGTFDGNGKAIEDAGSEVSNGSYQGIFGYIGATGTVKNLQAEDCSFRGYDYIGVIAGFNAGTIQNCRVKYDDNHNGNVTFTADGYSCYGTIAGFNSGTVRECVSSGVVRPTYDLNSYTDVTKAGGIVGHNTGTVANSLYIGSDVIATAYVGAIVGHNEGTLTNNYYHDNGIQEYSSNPITYGNVAAGTVKGVGISNDITGNDGGNAKKANVVTFVRASGSYINNQDYIGINAEPTLVTIINPNSLAYSVYANGILFDDGYVGSHEMGRAFYTAATPVGLTYTGTVPNGYEIVFNVESGENSSISGTTLTIGNDVVGVSATQQRVPVADSWLADGVRATSFSNTGTNNITIMTPAELGLLAYNVNFGGETYEGYTITLNTGINLNGHTWEPIGYGLGIGGGSNPGSGMVMPGGGSSSASGFLGTLDGAGMPILYMNTTYETNVGLFAILPEGATVKNLTISNATVKGLQYVGAVAGQCNGTITNCHVTSSSVEFTSNEDGSMCLGGISGSCTAGTISGCTVKSTSIYPASVSDARYIGGIVGKIASGIDYENEIAIPATLKDNLFTADMFIRDGFQYVGTIAGMNIDYSQYGMAGTVITNNYYVNGTAPYATSNTSIKAINGADIVDAAELACAYGNNYQPANIGTAGTRYEYNGVWPYTNGLYHNYISYTPISITIPGHGGAAGKWVFIASPVEGSIAFNTVSDLIGSVIPETDPVVYDFDFYRFNQSASSEWQNYHQHNTDDVNPFNALVNGQGYLYASKEDKELNFTGVFNTASTKTVDLVYDNDNDVQLKGWNLVGNPFPAPAYVNRPFYKMNAQGTGIVAVNDYENAPIDACTGIMVQAETTGESIKFGLSAPVTASNQGSVHIALSQTEANTRGASACMDNAIVSFNEGNELGKFYFGSQCANIYIPQGEEEYAIAFSDKQGEMPLNFKANEDGSYTLTVNHEGVEMAYLHLIDNMTGADIDLLATSAYTFTAKTTDYESRFRLVFSANSNETESDSFAFFSNGSWVIGNEGEATLQVIDLTGRILSNERINGSVSKDINAVSGIYMLRLVNGENVKTQKIVVR